MKKRIFTILILLLSMGLLIQPAVALAADYLFQVPREQVVFFINKDGTATIEYTYEFINQPGAHVIDYVDIGVPQTNDYDLKSVTADVDGKPITDIQVSDVIKPGIALGLGRNAIPAGGRGTVHARIGVVRKIIFESDLTNEKEPYASVSFSPSYFGREYIRGNTDLTVNIIFPQELGQEEPRYHPPQKWPGQAAPLTGADQATGLKFYSWQSATANAYTAVYLWRQLPGPPGSGWFHPEKTAGHPAFLPKT